MASKNPLKFDPSRTATLRRKLAQLLAGSIYRIQMKVNDLVRRQDAFGLKDERMAAVSRGFSPRFFLNSSHSSTRPPPSSLIVNANWSAETSATKIAKFQEWLQTQVKTELGSSNQAIWERYIADGFEKGYGRSYDEIRRSEAFGNKTLYDGGKREFLRAGLSAPVSVEKVQLLASRVFTGMKGVTDDIERRMTQALTDGLVQGKSPVEIARDLNRATELGVKRSRTIARTEIVRAHAEGQLAAMENLGVDKVGVMVEWSTAGDVLVCDQCIGMSKVVLDIREATGAIPQHPNCRCAWVPANVGESVKGQVRTEKGLAKAQKEAKEAGSTNPIVDKPLQAKQVIDITKAATTEGGAETGATTVIDEAAAGVKKPTSKKTKEKVGFNKPEGYRLKLQGKEETFVSETEGAIYQEEAKRKTNEYIRSHLKVDADVDDLLAAAGVPDGAEVGVYFSDQRYANTIDVVWEKEGYGNAVRSFRLADDGTLILENELVEIAPELRGGGEGMKVLGKQLEHAKRLGVDRIEIAAAGNAETAASGGYRGYSVWPKMGYDGPIPEHIVKRLPPDLSKAKNVSDLMKTQKGREWWAANGSDIELTLDLGNKSKGLKVASEYIAKRTGTRPNLTHKKVKSLIDKKAAVKKIKEAKTPLPSEQLQPVKDLVSSLRTTPSRDLGVYLGDFETFLGAGTRSDVDFLVDTLKTWAEDIADPFVRKSLLEVRDALIKARGG